MAYNLLPKNIISRFEVVYSELVLENITIFKNKNDKWGVFIEKNKFNLLKHFEILIQPIYDSIGFNKKLNFIEAVEYENGQWEDNKNNFYFFDELKISLAVLESFSLLNYFIEYLFKILSKILR